MSRDPGALPFDHQPPDPADLRRMPPANAECARIRGWLRDFADGELADAEAESVELHVHRCRSCAVELARAEHEVLRLRRAYAAELPAAPPDGFVAAVVDRLLLDVVRQVGVAPAPAAPGLSSSGIWPAAPAGTGARRQRLGLAFAVFTAVTAVAMLLLSVASDAAQVDLRAHTIVTSAVDATAGDRPVSTGSLGSQANVQVGERGELTAELHDAQPKTQPAAAVRMLGDGQMRIVDGWPTVMSGSLEVEAHRPVSIAVAGGGRIDVGTGRYLIEAGQFELPGGELSHFEDPLRGEPTVKVTVRSGDEARITRLGSDTFMVGVGETGIYRGGSAVTIVASPVDGPISLGGGGRTPADPPVLQPMVCGTVFGPGATTVDGANVFLRFTESGRVVTDSAPTRTGGEFHLDLGRHVDREFVIAQAVPPVSRPDLALLPPHVVPVFDRTVGVRLSLLLDDAPALTGRVVVDGQPRHAARVMPCLLDPVFGQLLPLAPVPAITDQHGTFVLRGLPTRLSPLQELALLVTDHAHRARLVVVPPPRSSAFASVSGSLQIALSPLQPVTVQGLPRGAGIEIVEELLEAPPGTAWREIQRRVADGNGRVQVLTGGGRLWTRVGPASRPQLRWLMPVPVRGGEAGVSPTSGVVELSPIIRDAGVVLAAGPVIVGWNFRAGSAFRDARPDVARGPRGLVRAVDAGSGVGVRGACLYAVAGSGQGPSQVRLLGVHDGGDAREIEFDRNEHTVVAIAPDGGMGMITFGPNSPPERLQVALRAPGTVVVGPSLRPPVDGADVALTLRFVPRGGVGTDPGSAVVGLPIVVTRFASARNAFEVEGVPPGDYRVEIGGRTIAIEVRPGVRTTLQ